MSSILRRLKFLVLLMAITIGCGTGGYMVLARLSFIDALYQTVIIITTIGFQDLAFTPGVKPFTIGLALVGAIQMAIFLSVITGGIVSLEVLSLVGRYKVEREIRSLRGHVLVCGYGRFGKTVARELRRKGTAFVVLENNPAKAASAREDKMLVIEADATDEQVLTHAGIEHASGLVTTLSSDADNVYVTLTAKQMKRSLLVVASAADDRSSSKLKAAGADRVVSAYRLGGVRMAQSISSPTVADFIELATGDNPVDFYMEQQRIGAGSSLSGKALKETSIRRDLGVIVVAVRTAGGELLTNPAPETVLAGGDTLVSLGTRMSLERLEVIARGGE